MKKLLQMTLFAMATLSGGVNAANYCGELDYHYGPFDYRLHGNLKIVEQAHFTADVEAGIKGSSSFLGDDLSYTLRALPNHPRALTTLAKIALRSKTTHIAHMKYPVECYFERAVRFTPDDGAVRAIYGSYLFALGRTGEALKMLQGALALLPQDPTINYNIGLVYFETKDYASAMRHAKVAYEMDFPLPGLKNKLVKAGKWEQVGN